MLIGIFNSCENTEVPTVMTTEILNITSNSASSGGIISDEGSGTIKSRGVCWSIKETPTILDNKTQDGEGSGSFTSNISSLNSNTTYYTRAYATNDVGTGYGKTKSFITLSCRTCRQVTYLNNVFDHASSYANYCGADLIAILASTPITIGNYKAQWECQ
jgi:hypothetical protein